MKRKNVKIIGACAIGTILFVAMFVWLCFQNAAQPEVLQSNTTNGKTSAKPAISSPVAVQENVGQEKNIRAEKSDNVNAGEIEEQLVAAFDQLTDKWQEPAADKVTMEDVNSFRERFNKVPQRRKDECVHRALNLIPDENVMLLAGILFDKLQEKEILEAVYNDILNRNEEVKKPILLQIFKDKSHPCWADTAWILDVTGELPKEGQKK